MKERRKATRCTEIPITIHQCVVTHLGKETWFPAAAVDVSSRGLCLLLDDSLNSGESVYLLASVQPEGKEARDLSVNCVTTNCRPTEGKPWRVGIQFIDLTPDEQADWDLFLQC